MSKEKITERKQVPTVLRNNEVIGRGYFENSHCKLTAKLEVELETH